MDSTRREMIDFFKTRVVNLKPKEEKKNLLFSLRIMPKKKVEEMKQDDFG